MSDPNERPIDLDQVVVGSDGSRIRPGRFSSDGTGLTITQPGEPEPDDDDGFEFLEAEPDDQA